MINGAVALMIGLYLVLALWNDRESDILKTISEQAGFVKWAGALLTLSYIYNVSTGKGGEIVRALTVTALVAMFVGNGDKMFQQVAELFGDNKNG